MPYDERGNGRLNQEKRALVLIVLLFLNLILISTQIVLKNNQPLLQTVFMNAVAPIQIAFQKSSDFVSHQFKQYVFLKGTYRRYRDLQRRYVELKHRQYEMQREIYDQRAMSRAKRRHSHFQIANVISVDFNFPWHTLLIDSGPRDGVFENMVVLNLDSELVGRVVKPLGGHTATVRMITSATGGAGAYLQSNMLEGFITGDNTSECSFKYLLENKPVRMGDWVVTSGTDLIFPPYLPVGRVASIEKDYLTQNIRIKPFFVEKPIKQLILLARETEN
jgi:rod shape-determining protein MreC